jgi:hypothetical protein
MCFKKLFSVELIPELDIMIFNSHGKNKKSYHVVLCTYYHYNNEEAKEFYKHVIAGMKYKEYVDLAVYSKKQQFRIVESSKFMSDRVKTFMPVWLYKGKFIKHNLLEYDSDTERRLIIIKKSLVSNVVDCKPLKCLFVAKEKKIIHVDYEENSVLKLIPEEFEFLNRKDSIINLKRLVVSDCVLCQREHEKENAFLSVRPDGGVYFHCRRIDKQSYKIGNVKIHLTLKAKMTPTPTPTPTVKVKAKAKVKMTPTPTPKVKKSLD